MVTNVCGGGLQALLPSYYFLSAVVLTVVKCTFVQKPRKLSSFSSIPFKNGGFVIICTP